METVVAAEYASEYKLKVQFSDGSEKIADLEPYLNGEIFAPLRDVGFFKAFKVDPQAGTVVWDNGADIAPDTLYQVGVDVDDVA